MNRTITLDYDPKYQKLIKLSGYIFYFQFLIFIAQLILLFHNRTLLGFATSGDWDNFLRMMNNNSMELFLLFPYGEVHSFCMPSFNWLYFSDIKPLSLLCI